MMRDQGISKRYYVVLKNFVNREEQEAVCNEALSCHVQNTKTNSETKATRQDDPDKNNEDRSKTNSTFITTFGSNLATSKTSEKLSLGVDCGGDLRYILPKSTNIIRRALRKVSSEYYNDSIPILRTLGKDSIPVTGLVLLYGPNASMKPHYDSPTQPGQKQEWLGCISCGASVIFRCNQDLIQFDSGDVLVMDSMSVLHGVERVLNERNDDVSNNTTESTHCGLPLGSRLGILMWQGRTQQHQQDKTTSLDGRSDTAKRYDNGTSMISNNNSEMVIDGVCSLFNDDDDSEE